jgi:YegS/Rv2252/BmrU family lipid kinase
MRLLIIVNSIVAQTHPEQVEKAIRLLCDSCAQSSIIETGKPVEATKIAFRARHEGVDRVVVIGGDGTINEVVNGLVGSKIPIAVIPLGTGNTFATNFRIPLSLHEACEVAVGGNVVTIDVGLLNHRYFACVAGVGFDAHVLHQLRPTFKRRFGKWAYAIASLRHLLRYRPSLIEVRMDGWERFKTDAWLTVISNVPTYALNFKFTPQASPCDGYIDVCIFFARGRFERLKQAALSLLGYHVRLGSVLYKRAKWLELVSSPNVFAHVDGEPVCLTPVSARVIPHSLKVVVPDDWADVAKAVQ